MIYLSSLSSSPLSLPLSLSLVSFSLHTFISSLLPLLSPHDRVILKRAIRPLMPVITSFSCSYLTLWASGGIERDDVGATFWRIEAKDISSQYIYDSVLGRLDDMLASSFGFVCHLPDQCERAGAAWSVMTKRYDSILLHC